MREFFADSMVTDYKALIEQMTNHPKDRHVLAAAVASRADYLVTFNLKHFVSPPAAAHEAIVIGPSAFLKGVARLDREIVEERLGQQAAAIGLTVSDLLDRLAGSVPGFVSMMRGA
jgi:hypothetical protein